MFEVVDDTDGNFDIADNEDGNNAKTKGFLVLEFCLRALVIGV